MKFIVESVTKQSGRLGRISKADKEMNTPLVLHYTKAGSLPHISREVFDMFLTEQQAIQVSIETTYSMIEGVKLLQKGITGFVGLEPTLSFATLKDSGKITSSFYSRDSVAITTRNGKKDLTPEKYMDCIAAFKPDLFHTLCDGDTNDQSGNKRIFNSVNRSETFFKACAERYKVLASLADSMLIVPIEGGYSVQHREDAIKSLNNYENQDLIGGYFIDGFHSNGESAIKINSSAVCDIVRKCDELLPSNKLKVMFGAYSPKQLLKLIQLNVDIFDTTYVYLKAMEHCALTFNIDINEKIDDDTEFQINLSDPIYKDKFEPFVKDCSCLACKNHTRAYTQHLISTRELLGPILLMIHNSHHYLEFFKIIRKCIADDTLPLLINHITEQQTKYELRAAEDESKKKESDDISSISSNEPKYKKLKNAEID